MLSADEQEIAKGVASAHREENDCLIVTIPKENFKQGYVVDVQKIINPRSNQEPARPTTRRRLPEYDMNDPFIDDSEIMAMGGAVQDCLSGGGDDQLSDEPAPGEGYVKARRDFLVWRGRLPEPQEDPLWAEHVKPAPSTSRTSRKVNSVRKKSMAMASKKVESSSTGKKRKGDSQDSKQEGGSSQKKAEGKTTSKKEKDQDHL